MCAAAPPLLPAAHLTLPGRADRAHCLAWALLAAPQSWGSTHESGGPHSWQCTPVYMHHG